MKYFILGAGGMAGHMIAVYLSERGYTVTGLDRRPSPVCETVVCDVTDLRALDDAVASQAPDVIVNCIGVLNQFAEQDKEAAVFLNAFLPHHLAKITADTPCRVVHLSTDCVFSGKNPPYACGDLRDGETFYDRSKALGELEDDKNLTVRGSIVGPDLNPNGIGLLNWFMRQSGEINGFVRAIWTGQTTLQLAKTIEAAVTDGAAGLYNTVPDGPISKYELLGLFNRELRDGAVTIRPQDTFVCDKTLIASDAPFCRAIPGYVQMVRELAEWMRAHRALYPHYFG
ncbi:MAG: SDR family oxidoreductase [Clostridia bacterium]|nr:SDR family oxidoreductase [Clostridia bacterium]